MDSGAGVVGRPLLRRKQELATLEVAWEGALLFGKGDIPLSWLFPKDQVGMSWFLVAGLTGGKQ